MTARTLGRALWEPLRALPGVLADAVIDIHRGIISFFNHLGF